MLEKFWKGPGRALTPDEAAALERLLALPDNDLLDLVMRRTESPDARLQAMLEKLRTP